MFSQLYNIVLDVSKIIKFISNIIQITRFFREMWFLCKKWTRNIMKIK